MNPLPFVGQIVAVYTLIGLLLTLATISNTKVDDEDLRMPPMQVLCLFLGAVWPVALLAWLGYKVSRG